MWPIRSRKVACLRRPSTLMTRTTRGRQNSEIKRHGLEFSHIKDDRKTAASVRSFDGSNDRTNNPDH